jgi:acyl carrier protein
MNATAAAIASLIEAACPNVRIDEGDYATNLSTLGIDSLDVAVIFLNISEQFGVKIPDADIDGLDSVERVAQYIAEYGSRT